MQLPCSWTKDTGIACRALHSAPHDVCDAGAVDDPQGSERPLVERWPADHVCVAAVGPRGLLSYSGDLDRPFPLASVTKPLVATAVLVAVEEGAIGLDDPAGPEGSTIRHLLAHASGLAADDDGTLARPGQRRIYSNRGFEVLGEALAAATGFTVADYLTEGVLVPLGMARTRLDGSAASGAVSTVGDLAAWVAEMLEPTRLLHPSTVAEARTPQFPDLSGVLPGFGRQEPNPWGLGLEIRGHKAPHWTGLTNSPATFGHFGQSGTFVWIDPDAHLGVVGLGDRAFGDWAVELWPRLSDTILAEHRAG
jgi:CubicO group peptidase (beta-lactamase class C family)